MKFTWKEVFMSVNEWRFSSCHKPFCLAWFVMHTPSVPSLYDMKVTKPSLAAPYWVGSSALGELNSAFGKSQHVGLAVTCKFAIGMGVFMKGSCALTK